LLIAQQTAGYYPLIAQQAVDFYNLLIAQQAAGYYPLIAQQVVEGNWVDRSQPQASAWLSGFKR
jgi:hypothetical protein